MAYLRDGALYGARDLPRPHRDAARAGRRKVRRSARGKYDLTEVA